MRFYFILLMVILLTSCKDTKITAKHEIKKEVIYSPLPEIVIHPKNNLPNEYKIQLGKLLFYDPVLSGNKDVACVSCHHPDFGYAEGLDLSIGVNGVGLSRSRKFTENNSIPIVKRNAHTVLNTGFNGMNESRIYDPASAPMFWDIRKESLEEQAIAPIQSLEEMKGLRYSEEEILDTIVARLQSIKEYKEYFRKAFPENPVINITNIGKSIACFERSLITPNSRFDQFIAGDDSVLSKGEKKGFELFKSAGCATCHSGPMFSDYKLHVLGVPENPKLSYIDVGTDSTFAFRTPSLRNLRFTAPYMHNGKFNDLQGVLEFYEDISTGQSINPNVLDKEMDSLAEKITIKVKDMSLIISFFNSLNSTNFDKEIPSSVPSKLPVGGNIH